MTALAKANEVRLKRADTKNWIKDAPRAEALRRVVKVVETCPWECESMAVSELLLSVRRMGWTAVRKTLGRIPVPENKTLGSMTERQRKKLAEALDELAERVAR